MHYAHVRMFHVGQTQGTLRHTLSLKDSHPPPWLEKLSILPVALDLNPLHHASMNQIAR